jgi:hypothetical protein
MKKILTLSIIVLGLAGRTEAANFAVITSPPTLLNVFILGFAVACVAGASRVLTLVRGGHLSRSWQLFTAGFVVLVLCQLAILGNAFELITLPSFVVPAGLALMCGLFLYGIFETRRVLS